MKEFKRRLDVFSFYDHTGIEAHLEKMAANGWELHKITNFGWLYRRIEPKKMHFTVTYYPQASAFDPAPSEGERTFQDFCAEAGWRLAAASAQLQIFCNEGENPIPIETDAALQVETIHKAIKKAYLPSYILLLLVGILNGVLFWTRLWNDPIGLLASSANLFTGVCWLITTILCLVEIISYFEWHRRAKAAADLDGSFVETRGHRHLQITMLYIVLLGAIYWLLSLASSREMIFGILGILFMVAFIVLVNAVRNLLKRKRVPAGINRIVTIFICVALPFAMAGGLVLFTIRAVNNGWMDERNPIGTYEYNGWTWDIYQDELPLTVEDMADVSYDGYSCEWTTNTSPFLAQLDATQRARLDAPDVPNLEYTITKVKVPIIYDLCLNGLFRKYTDKDSIAIGYHFVEQDASLWGAEKAYQLYSREMPMNKYLVCMTDRIVEISFGWEPTTEQIAVAADKLKTI